MKARTAGIMAVCVFLLSTALTACNSNGQDGPVPTNTTPSPSVTPETPAPGNVDYSALGWTEDEIRLWEERGAANADSAEVATALAGFKVVTPGFIPESLEPMSKYMVQDHQAGLRSAGMEPKFEWIDVTLLYAREGERSPIIIFTQSTHKFNAGLGEPTELCGRTVEKDDIPADPKNGINEPGLAFGWEHNGIWYYLTGMLTDTIDEATLEKVLCSITTE